MDDRKDVARTKHLVEELRKLSGWTYSKMAQRAGMAHTTLSRFMRAEDPTHNLKADTVRRVFKTLYSELMRELPTEERDTLNAGRSVGLLSSREAQSLHAIRAAYNQWLVAASDLNRQELANAAGAIGTLHVVGHVQAGDWREGIEWALDDQYPIPYPTEGMHMANVFGLEVRGNSMDKRFGEGTILICRWFDSDEDEYPLDKYVIVQRRDRATSDFEATCKRLVVIDGFEWLVPESTDPRHQAIQMSDGDDVHIAAIVIGAYEKF